MPSAEIWGEFPVLAVLALIFAGLFVALRWFWGEYVKERDKERAWREEQNAKRETAAAYLNRSWQDMVKDLFARAEKSDADQNTILKELINLLGRHDDQAKEIKDTTLETLDIVKRIDRQTAPIGPKPRIKQ